MHRPVALVIALALAALGGCFTTVDSGQPPAAPPPPAPVVVAAPLPEPVPVPVAPPPPAVMGIAEFCMSFAANTCNRLGACNALPMPVQQCTGEINGLCQQRAGVNGIAAIGMEDAAGCFTAIGSFGCRDFARMHGKGRVHKACTRGSLKGLYQ